MRFFCMIRRRKNIRLDNGHVKLLYVAATRALHELVVLYHGNLSRILTDPVSKEKKQKVFAAETLTKAKEYEKKTIYAKRNRAAATDGGG